MRGETCNDNKPRGMRLPIHAARQEVATGNSRPVTGRCGWTMQRIGTGEGGERKVMEMGSEQGSLELNVAWARGPQLPVVILNPPVQHRADAFPVAARFPPHAVLQKHIRRSHRHDGGSPRDAASTDDSELHSPRLVLHRGDFVRRVIGQRRIVRGWRRDFDAGHAWPEVVSPVLRREDVRNLDRNLQWRNETVT